MKKRIVILGGGMVGSAIAVDLARDGWPVTVVERRPDVAARLRTRWHLDVREADVSDADVVGALAAEHDLVVGALPSVLGLQTLAAVIDAGRDMVDISFMAENALELDERARARGVTAVVDCGVAPGVSNMMVGHAAAALDRCDRVEIYVGGLPVERRWPFDYKAGFAPSDVIEEYVRPARLVEHGRIVVREALSEPEYLSFDGIGTLEAFNTDGLRSLLFTVQAPEMKEKTLRYPGHVALMRILREIGFFDKTPLDLPGQAVRPLDVTAALMFPKWTFDEGEADLTVMRVRVDGHTPRGPVSYRWDLFDRFDESTGLRSMSRTTAFPAAIVARLMAEGAFRLPGVSAPEVFGARPGMLDLVLHELRTRGVKVSGSVRPCQAEVSAPEPDLVGVN